MRPQKLTDSAGSIVWDALYTPFGEVDAITGSLTQNLEFPGQYKDDETGFAQNWHRDYDAGLGRYIQSDPIGLMGGINTYAYVDGNPISNIDPDGRIVFLVIPGLCAAGGCEALIAGAVMTAAMMTPQGQQAMQNAADDAYTVVLAICSSGDDEDGYDHQYYNVDIPTCRGISRSRGAPAGAACYASAAERYGACLAGKPIPPLDTWNN